jgi:hypothetical protein
MATVTPNFNWPVPTSTDLVKDGATAIEALGDSIDGSLVDLKGGTTGQVLSKTSGTDMDFTWVTTDDANAIQNSIVDAKGDLISATANDTPARLAVGANGETLVADSSASTGLRYQGNFAAGKNTILNGDFSINQRSFTSTTTTATFGFDRWQFQCSDGTVTYSTQAFTAGTAPVAGYEGTNFARIVTTGQTTSTALGELTQKIENVRTLAGQTATVSFWAKAASGTPKIAVEAVQDFGSGGSPSSAVFTVVGSSTISTAWTRYTITIAIPSISGKTVGTTANTSSLAIRFFVSAGTAYNSRTGSLGIQTNTFDIWGVQVEAGSVATAFQTATGTLQGELAACQRYFERWSLETSNMAFAGFNASTTNGYHTWHFHTKKRSEPTISVNAATDFSVRIPAGNVTLTAFSTIGTTTDGAWLSSTVASGLGSGDGNFLVNSGVGSFIQASSEL